MWTKLPERRCPPQTLTIIGRLRAGAIVINAGIAVSVLAVAGVILPGCSDGGRSLLPTTPTPGGATPVITVTSVLSGTITDLLDAPM